MAQWKQMRLVTMRMQVQSLASLSALKSQHAVSCGVSRRCGLAATALIGPLAWEPEGP